MVMHSALRYVLGFQRNERLKSWSTSWCKDFETNNFVRLSQYQDCEPRDRMKVTDATLAVLSALERDFHRCTHDSTSTDALAIDGSSS